MAFTPTSELVAVAWLLGVAGVPAGKVATVLPAATADYADGFLVATIVGGVRDVRLPARRPVVQVDCWVATEGSSKPRWGRAFDLAESVSSAQYLAPGWTERIVSLRAEYNDARVMQAYLLSEPRRVPNDPGRHAHVTFDMQIHWTTA